MTKSYGSISYDGTGYWRIRIAWRSGVDTECIYHFPTKEKALKYALKHYPNVDFGGESK